MFWRKRERESPVSREQVQAVEWAIDRIWEGLREAKQKAYEAKRDVDVVRCKVAHLANGHSTTAARAHNIDEKVKLLAGVMGLEFKKIAPGKFEIKLRNPE